MRFFPLSLLWTCFFCACSPSLLQKPPSAQPSSSSESALSKNEIRVESSLDDADPLNFWMQDLLNPALESLSEISWDCVGDATVFHLSKYKIDCGQLRDANLRAGLALSCPLTDELKIWTGHKRCLPDEKPAALLQQIRLPMGQGLFVVHTSHLFEANTLRFPAMAGTLLPLHFVKEAPFTLAKPTFRNWFSARTESGAFRLDLRAHTNDASMKVWLTEFKSFLIHEKKPSFLPTMNIEAHFTPISLGSSKEMTLARLPFVTLNYKTLKDRLYLEACESLDHWIRAREVLAGLDPLDSRHVEVDCVFAWADEGVTEASLTLARLPLPLWSPEMQFFPLRSIEDARSPTALQSLRTLLKSQ